MISFVVGQANIDFANTRADDLSVLKTMLVDNAVDLLFVEEAKDRVLHALLVKLGLDSQFVVLQDLTNAATAGSAIIFRRSLFTRVGPMHRVLGVAHGRLRMLDRHIVHQALRHRKSGKTFRAAVFHAPPKRFAVLQRPMDFVVERIFRGRRLPVLAGTDANRHLGRSRSLGELLKASNATAYGPRTGIDYFIAEAPFRLTHVHVVAIASDHPGLVGVAHLP